MDRKWAIGLSVGPLLALAMFGLNSCYSAWQRQTEALTALRMAVGDLTKTIEGVDIRRGMMIDHDREKLDDLKQDVEKLGEQFKALEDRRPR